MDGKRKTAALSDEELKNVSGGAWAGAYIEDCPFGFDEARFPDICVNGGGDHCLGYTLDSNGKRVWYQCPAFSYDNGDIPNSIKNAFCWQCCFYKSENIVIPSLFVD